MSERRRVGILFGGSSVEHEVSVISARGVVEALSGAELDGVPLGVTAEGRWLSPELSRSILESDLPRVEPAEADDGARIAIVPGSGKLLCLRRGGPPQPVDIDVVFPLVHGWGGEDGRVQGALDLAGIPYVGGGVLASAAAMDKGVAKQIFAAHRLPGVRWLGFDHPDYGRQADAIVQRIVTGLGLPVFVKPANGGSSVGISRVADRDGLGRALEEAFEHDARVVVEEAVDAREIECAVLGNDEPRASVLGEIIPGAEFYDYAAKYLDRTSRLEIPAALDSELAERIRRQAVEAFRCLGLAGFARVDFLLERKTGEVYLNEVNTLPGFTPISMFPKLWEATGLPYAKLIERLVDLALNRRRTEQDRRVRRREGRDSG